MWGWLTSIAGGVAQVVSTQITEYTDRKREIKAAKAIIGASLRDLEIRIVKKVKNPSDKLMVEYEMRRYAKSRELRDILKHIQTIAEDE